MEITQTCLNAEFDLLPIDDGNNEIYALLYDDMGQLVDSLNYDMFICASYKNMGNLSSTVGLQEISSALDYANSLEDAISNSADFGDGFFSRFVPYYICGIELVSEVINELLTAGSFIRFRFGMQVEPDSTVLLVRNYSGLLCCMEQSDVKVLNDGSVIVSFRDSVDAALFLVAPPEINIPTITFNSTAGTFPSDSTTSKSVQTNLDGTVSLSTLVEFPIKQSYVFKGWSTTETGSVVYTPYATPTITEDATLYAVWEEAESYLVREDTLVNIANAVRSIDDGTIAMAPSGIVSALGSVNAEIATQADLISQIQSVCAGMSGKKQLDTSDATATVADILQDKVAYANYVKLVGEHICDDKDCKYIEGTFSQFSDSTIGTIGDYAFAGCYSLTSASLPNATTIGNRAFYGCSNLTSINLPNATTIGDYAFYSCTSLISAQFSLVSDVKIGTFNSCTSLTSINLPNATTIGDYAFQKCTSLISVNLPAVTTIGSCMFQSCTSLTSINLPNATTTMGLSAFRDCTSLTSVNLPKATTICSYAFYGCISLTSVSLPNATTISDYAFYKCTSLTSINLPKATTISSYAFCNCSSLTSVSLPNATIIGSRMFESCTSLTSINLPKATTICEYAFQNCTSLTSVSLPAATSISGYAFSGCTNLISLYLTGSSVCSIAEYFFYPFKSTPIASGTGYIYVPTSLVNSYKTNRNWKSYATQIIGI